jgi:hypothetical protein
MLITPLTTQPIDAIISASVYTNLDISSRPVAKNGLAL